MINIMDIPTELVYIIVENLPYIEDLLNFAICNKRCYSVVHSHLAVRCKQFKYDDYVVYMRKNLDVQKACFNTIFEYMWDVDYYGYYLSDREFLRQIQEDEVLNEKVLNGTEIGKTLQNDNYAISRIINKIISKYYNIFSDKIVMISLLKAPYYIRKYLDIMLYSKLKYDDYVTATDEDIPEYIDRLSIMMIRYMETVLSDEDRKFTVTGKQ